MSIPILGTDRRTPRASGTEPSPRELDESLVDVPEYYEIRLPGDVVEEIVRTGRLTVFDVTDALVSDMNIGHALKYLVRAGRKPMQPKSKCLRKAVRCVERALRVEGRKSELDQVEG